MARIKFKIGSSPGVHFNLPSREHGNSEVCRGKVSLDSGKLKCSGEFSIDREQLVNLVINAKSIISSAKGACHIMSKCNRLSIGFSVTRKGHLKVIANMTGFEFSFPENREWRSESTFYLYPDSLKEVLDSESEICS
jgi:hypothetical protein